MDTASTGVLTSIGAGVFVSIDVFLLTLFVWPLYQLIQANHKTLEREKRRKRRRKRRQRRRQKKQTGRDTRRHKDETRKRKQEEDQHKAETAEAFKQQAVSVSTTGSIQFATEKSVEVEVDLEVEVDDEDGMKNKKNKSSKRKTYFSRINKRQRKKITDLIFW